MGNTMQVQSWVDMEKKYPVDRSIMHADMLHSYLDDAFILYEKEGFADKFWCFYGDYKEYQGQPFVVVARCSEGDVADLDSLPMWNIKFADGKVIGAYPEEIIPSEMKGNGCPYYSEEHPAASESITANAVLCGQCNHSENSKSVPCAYTCKNKKTPCYGRTTYADFGCMYGERKAEETGHWVLSVVDDEDLMTPVVTGVWCSFCGKPGVKTSDKCQHCGRPMTPQINE